MLKNITVAKGDLSGTTGSLERLVISLENTQVHMDFLVIDNPPFDVSIELPTLKLLQACIDLENKMVSMSSRKEELKWL